MCSLTAGKLFPHTRAVTLLERTKSLLNERIEAGLNLREIADASGGSVPHEWLKKFNRGRIAKPGVDRIESLYNCLKKIRRPN